MIRKDYLKLAASIVVCELAGIIGSIFTSPAIPTWYATLIKPSFQPPSWLFAPVWTILFILMGVAVFLVWRKGLEQRQVKIAIGVFIVQLILNTLWSIIFFGQQNPAGAFLEIIFLWIAIIATIFIFAKISRAAAWLLIPYILWVSFAGFLNYTIWQLNLGTNSQVQVSIPDSWKTVIDDKNQLTFRYPEQLNTQYIRFFDWPPQAQVINRPFSCTEGGNKIMPAGETTSADINNRIYCVTKEVGAAAGSIYTQYAWSWGDRGNTVILTFTIRADQCGNYDEDLMKECEAERATFSIDGIIDQIANSLYIIKPS